MHDILCIANDSGGARLLVPVIADAIAQGRSVRALAAGPAEPMWSDLSIMRDTAAGDDAAWISEYLARQKPRLILTGTSHFSDLERNSWVAAHDANVPSVGAIDAWVNFPERFVRSDGVFVQPDNICVIDKASRDRLIADSRVTADVYVCGQPHLETLVASLLDACATRPANGALSAVFFSNPVFTNLPTHEQPYDQFTAADALVGALRGIDKLDLFIKPHPREDAARWARWIAERKHSRQPRIAMTQRKSDELLVACDGICGITSMTLIEAALLGRPVLSLQPGRLRAHNPMIEELEGVRLAVSKAEVSGAVKAWLDDVRDARRRPTDMPACIHGSRRNYLNLLDRLLEVHR